MRTPNHATPHVEAFYDEATSTLSYVVADMKNKVCVVIDPVLDLNDGSAEISTHSAGRIVRFIEDCELRAAYVLKTHAHADQLSAGCYLKQKLSIRGLHVVTFQVATRVTCISLLNGCTSCRNPPGCSFAMIISQTVDR